MTVARSPLQSYEARILEGRVELIAKAQLEASQNMGHVLRELTGINRRLDEMSSTMRDKMASIPEVVDDAVQHVPSLRVRSAVTKVLDEKELLDVRRMRGRRYEVIVLALGGAGGAVLLKLAEWLLSLHR